MSFIFNNPFKKPIDAEWMSDKDKESIQKCADSFKKKINDKKRLDRLSNFKSNLDQAIKDNGYSLP